MIKTLKFEGILFVRVDTWIVRVKTVHDQHVTSLYKWRISAALSVKVNILNHVNVTHIAFLHNYRRVYIYLAYRSTLINEVELISH